MGFAKMSGFFASAAAEWLFAPGGVGVGPVNCRRGLRVAALGGVVVLRLAAQGDYAGRRGLRVAALGEVVVLRLAAQGDAPGGAGCRFPHRRAGSFFAEKKEPKNR